MVGVLTDLLAGCGAPVFRNFARYTPPMNPIEQSYTYTNSKYAEYASISTIALELEGVLMITYDSPLQFVYSSDQLLVFDFFCGWEVTVETEAEGCGSY